MWRLDHPITGYRVFLLSAGLPAEELRFEPLLCRQTNSRGVALFETWGRRLEPVVGFCEGTTSQASWSRHCCMQFILKSNGNRNHLIIHKLVAIWTQHKLAAIWTQRKLTGFIFFIKHSYQWRPSGLNVNYLIILLLKIQSKLPCEHHNSSIYCIV